VQTLVGAGMTQAKPGHGSSDVDKPLKRLLITEMWVTT
jgi:hypothetical protein